MHLLSPDSALGPGGGARVTVRLRRVSRAAGCVLADACRVPKIR